MLYLNIVKSIRGALWNPWLCFRHTKYDNYMENDEAVNLCKLCFKLSNYIRVLTISLPSCTTFKIMFKYLLMHNYYWVTIRLSIRLRHSHYSLVIQFFSSSIILSNLFANEKSRWKFTKTTYNTYESIFDTKKDI